MPRINAFLFLTLNGFYKDQQGDIAWHQHDQDGERFSEEQLAGDSILLFGRVTYEMMAAFWPTPMAREMMPEVAAGMNRARKLVISKSMSAAAWENTEVLSHDFIDRVRELKASGDRPITILGSGSIVRQLTDAELIDDYQFLIDPIAIGGGTPIFSDLKEQLNLKLVDSKVFGKGGSILLTYERMRS